MSGVAGLRDAWRERVAANDGVQLLHFALGQGSYACDVDLVEEVVFHARVHPLPDMPPALLGVLRTRGELIPVLDVSSSLAEQRGSGGAATLIVELDSHRVGVAVDDVHDVIHVAAGALRPPPVPDAHTPVVAVAPQPGGVITIVDLAEMLRDRTTLAVWGMS